ncbi:hypothetical protein BHM03_00057336 [Ensete ventricosum]|nr:hypothetical protein BHM03_00057336 [Ensete ventricosum]
MALRNVVYRILPNATDVAEALAESRYFREAIGLFSDAIVVSCQSMLEWVEAAKNQEDPLLNEARDHQCPSHFITEAIEEEEAHPQQVENPPQSKCGGRSQTTSDAQLSQATKHLHNQPHRSQSAQRAKAKEKGKAVPSATPLERIESGDETPSQSHSATRSVQRHNTIANSSSSTDNGGDVGQSYESSTQVEGGV